MKFPFIVHNCRMKKGNVLVKYIKVVARKPLFKCKSLFQFFPTKLEKN